MYIFLDLDGVLVDFLKGACKVFGLEEQELLARWPKGLWDFATALGISDEEFYRKIEKQGEQYWEDLEPFPWADELFEFCESLAPTMILTTPTYDADCLSGKVKWMQKWKGRNFRNYILTPRKEACSRYDRVLIDDRDENCERFAKHGEAIVFPYHTNSRYPLQGSAMEVVKKEIVEFVKKTKRIEGTA